MMILGELSLSFNDNFLIGKMERVAVPTSEDFGGIK